VTHPHLVIALTVVLAAGLVALILLIVSISRRGTHQRGERDLYRRASLNLIRAMPDEDEQAIRDHERLVEQYRGMIDELYDYGEQIAQYREGRPRD
jgi:hypothetical protein